MWNHKIVKQGKRWLQKTPNALLCVLGAVLFLLVFYTLAYRTPPDGGVDGPQYG